MGSIFALQVANSGDSIPKIECQAHIDSRQSICYDKHSHWHSAVENRLGGFPHGCIPSLPLH